MMDFSFQQFDQTTYEKMLAAMLETHRTTFDAYEQFRKMRASCHNDAKQLAGDKPVTDTYMERAFENTFGAAALEEGKSLFHRLQALSVQIQGLSALISSQPKQ